MTRVSFAIQAHPLRAESACALAERIGGDIDVVYDPDPNSHYRSPWRTYRECLRLTPGDATHRMIVQDDVRLCNSFRATVELAVAARPERVLLFFIGNNPQHFALKVMQACQNDEAWAEMPWGHWLPVVAACWPRDIGYECVDYNDSMNWGDNFGADDERCGRFISHIKHYALASVPSLVEHPDDVPSVVRSRPGRNGADPGRLAACWIGDCAECDPREIDWTTGDG